MIDDKCSAVLHLLFQVAKENNALDDIFVVGGAVRNWVLKKPVKDIDLVLDSTRLGKDADWFALCVQSAIKGPTNLTTNQYGVAILTISGNWRVNGIDLRGEVIEIATARKESYGGPEGKGYKPHMVSPATVVEDLYRREFTFNTLMWRLRDLENGPTDAPVLDMTERGKGDLLLGRIQTPMDPDKTFSDDPTRMLRAVKFASRYGFTIADEVRESIRRNAPKLLNMPWDAVRKILVHDLIEGENAEGSLTLLLELGLAPVLGEFMEKEKGFATAVSRSIQDKPANVLISIHNLGWPVVSPIAFMSAIDRARFRAHIESHPSTAPRLLTAFKTPPIDQMKLFTTFSIPEKSRKIVSQIARRIILDQPFLSDEAIEQEVAAKLATEFT